MKRISIVGLLLVVAFAIWAWANTNRVQQILNRTITGVASGNDSVLTDTTFLFQTLHYRNRIIGTIILDSITQHTAGVTNSFGLADTVKLILKSFTNGQYVSIDSTGKVMTVATTCTLFVNNTVDSAYGDHIILITRIADSLGVDTDSIVRFRIRANLIHAYQD